MHMRVVYLQSARDATFEMLAAACNGKLNMLKFSLAILRYLSYFSSDFPRSFHD